MKRVLVVTLLTLAFALPTGRAEAQGMRAKLSSYKTAASYLGARFRHRINRGVLSLTPRRRQQVDRLLEVNGRLRPDGGMSKIHEPFLTKVRFRRGKLRSVTVHTFSTTDNGVFMSPEHPKGLPWHQRVADYGKLTLKPGMVNR